MSYDRSFNRGRGRGGFRDDNSNKFSDRGPRDSFPDRRGRSFRRPGNFERNFSNDFRQPSSRNRDEFKERDNVRIRDKREDFDKPFNKPKFDRRDKRDYASRSPLDHRRDYPRNRSLSPRGRDLVRELMQRSREFVPKPRDFDERRFSPGRFRDDNRPRHFNRRDQTPPQRSYEYNKRGEYSLDQSRDRRFSPRINPNNKFNNPPRRQYDRNDISDGKRNTFRPQSNRDYRSRSPNPNERRGGGNFRGYRGRGNITRYDGSQRT